MIKVYTDHPEFHLKEIIAAAKNSDGETSLTWSHRRREDPIEKDKDGAPIYRSALYHDTKSGDWADKGEFWCFQSEKDGYIRFAPKWIAGKEKNADAMLKLHGRLVELLLSYFRKVPDFQSIEIDIPGDIKKMD